MNSSGGNDAKFFQTTKKGEVSARSASLAVHLVATARAGRLPHVVTHSHTHTNSHTL
jgi:hypothetical protein